MTVFWGLRTDCPAFTGDVGTIWEAPSPNANGRLATAVTTGDLNLSAAMGAEREK